MENKPVMFPDVFKLLIENIPAITPLDAKDYSRKIAALFASFKEDFNNDVYFTFYTGNCRNAYKRAIRGLLDELSRKY